MLQFLDGFIYYFIGAGMYKIVCWPLANVKRYKTFAGHYNYAQKESG